MQNIKRRFIAGAAIASLATGAMAGAANATTSSASQADTTQASTQAKHKFQYISQVQGQRSQWSDCGFASSLMAILQKGGDLPSKYSDSSQKDAMTQLRDEVGLGPDTYLNTDQMPGLLESHGVSGKAYVNGDAPNVVDQIKDGKSAIILTSTGVIENENISGPGGDGHFVYVSGYDKDKNTFTVNDPIKKEEKPYQATEKQLRTIIASNAADNTPWAYAV